MKLQSVLSAVLGLASPAITASTPATKPVFCTECGLAGKHSDMCSDAPLSEERVFRLTMRIEAMHRERLEHIARIDRLTDSVTKWQGRHAIVRHENNVLRRTMYRQEKKAKQDAMVDDTTSFATAFGDTAHIDTTDTERRDFYESFSADASPFDTVVVEK